MKVIHRLHMVQISFQELHNTERGILRFEAISGANGIQNFHSPKFWLFLQVLQNFRFSHFSFLRAGIGFVSTCSILLLSVQFFFTFLSSLVSTAMTTIFFSTTRSERNSVSRTLMVSSVKVMGNEQLLNQFRVWALKSKEFMVWVLDAKIPRADKIACVIADKEGLRVQEKSGMPSTRIPSCSENATTL